MHRHDYPVPGFMVLGGIGFRSCSSLACIASAITPTSDVSLRLKPAGSENLPVETDKVERRSYPMLYKRPFNRNHYVTGLPYLRLLRNAHYSFEYWASLLPLRNLIYSLQFPLASVSDFKNKDGQDKAMDE
ncbi:hypothetical protein TNCV_4215401 [Trichonephila clavipes]|nr:hypothetical protein TNCV_4215401 [Trichonephila clavipes]